ncbi:MAG: phosphodiester glycosidase family protein [Allosphingosinicella sp.]|uniref:phosphodiester glycosidase family protein n=1 Tax=Allosphingosinicella sp. TaxID=2823234 RepID=UPI0039624557
MAAIRSSRRATVTALLLAAAGGAAWLLWPRSEPAAPPRSLDDLLAPAESACEQIEFEGSRFTACRYRRGEDRIELFLDPGGRPLRSLAALERHLGPRAEALRFAMNAGMYDRAGRPIGLYIEDGNERRALNTRNARGNFHLKPNGVFTVDGEGRVAIVTSDDYEPSEAIRWATQSGPMLVIDGQLHPRFSENGASLHVRNGVGVSNPETAWFAISDEPVSFGRFARLFRDRLGCPNALFLDGAVSSLWDRPAGRRDAYPSLGPLIAVFSEPSAPRP